MAVSVAVGMEAQIINGNDSKTVLPELKEEMMVLD